MILKIINVETIQVHLTIQCQTNIPAKHPPLQKFLISDGAFFSIKLIKPHPPNPCFNRLSTSLLHMEKGKCVWRVNCV